MFCFFFVYYEHLRNLLGSHHCQCFLHYDSTTHFQVLLQSCQGINLVGGGESLQQHKEFHLPSKLFISEKDFKTFALYDSFLKNRRMCYFSFYDSITKSVQHKRSNEYILCILYKKIISNSLVIGLALISPIYYLR